VLGTPPWYDGVSVPADQTDLYRPPGSTLPYTFQVNNAGDLQEDLVLHDLNAGHGSWISVYPATLSAVASGEERTVQVQVHIPMRASMGQQQEDEISLCSYHDASACQTVTLHTAVTDYKVFIPAVMRQVGAPRPRRQAAESAAPGKTAADCR